MELKNLFYNSFPEYKGKTGRESEKAFIIFKAGIESALIIKEESENTLFLVSESKREDEVKKIISYLNEARKKMSGNSSLRGFKKTTSVTSSIKARIKEGHHIDEFFMVIDHKCSEWNNTAFQQYIRPSTLFSSSHFHEYLLEAEAKIKKPASVLDQEVNTLMEG